MKQFFSSIFKDVGTLGIAELCLDVLNITMHTEVTMHSMNTYVWCWSKACGSLDEMGLLVTMGHCKSKILNEI